MERRRQEDNENDTRPRPDDTERDPAIPEDDEEPEEPEEREEGTTR